MNVKPTILCVDDEVDNIEALERIFRKKFHVLKATSGEQALGILQAYQEPISLIITDQRMPEMTGVEFLEKTLPTHPETMRILLTGYTDLDSVISAVNQGQIFRYLTKPWDPIDLGNTVDRAVERYELGQELKRKNVELQAAYEELKTLDKAKSNFMILVNHELKTPLTSVLNFVALLGETKMDDEQKLFVDRISRSGERLKTLIEDVLLVVRAETGQLKADVRPVVIDGMQNQLSPSLKTSLADKRQNFTEKMSGVSVMADLHQVRQVLHRLIHNASKFGLEDSEILFEATDAGDGITFSVTNRGDPISAQAIRQIFKPFFLDEDVMNHSVGMGLGLTICQSLLRVHGSELKIQNHSNGVTVGFTLKKSA